MNIPINDETRCQYLLTNQGGIVWESLNAVKLGVDEGHSDKFHYVDYNNLVKDPQNQLNLIYEFLGEEPFEHTFDNLSNEHREDDITTYGLGDMHEVHSKLEKVSTDPSKILPASIIELYNHNKSNLEFWHHNGVVDTQPKLLQVLCRLTQVKTYNLFHNLILYYGSKKLFFVSSTGWIWKTYRSNSSCKVHQDNFPSRELIVTGVW